MNSLILILKNIKFLKLLAIFILLFSIFYIFFFKKLENITFNFNDTSQTVQKTWQIKTKTLINLMTVALTGYFLLRLKKFFSLPQEQIVKESEGELPSLTKIEYFQRLESIAYHEAGHTLVLITLFGLESFEFCQIVLKNNSLEGITQNNLNFLSACRQNYLKKMAIDFAGVLAEESLIHLDKTEISGYTTDFTSLVKLAKEMVYSQSLSSNSSDFFPCIFLTEKELIYASERTKQYYEEQVNFFLREAQFLARSVLTKK